MPLRITSQFNETETSREFESTSVVIGRPDVGAPEGIFDLAPDLLVSRRHAMVEFKDGVCWLTDLGSRTGTRVNGEDIGKNGARSVMAHDTVEIGGTRLRISYATPTPTSRPTTGLETQVSSSMLPGMSIVRVVDTDSKAPVVVPRGSSATEARLALVLDLPRQFSAQNDTAGLFQAIMTRVVEVIPTARRGALLLRDEEHDKLLLTAYVSDEEPAVSETLTRRALAERRAFIWRLDPTGDLSVSIRSLQIVTGMYVPIHWRDRVFGVICVDSPLAKDSFTEQDLQFLIAVAHFAGMALAQQRQGADLIRNQKLVERLLANFSPKIRSLITEQARLGKLRPGGVKSEVTILYCDLCGFTQRAADMDAHDVVDMLNDYFRLMIDAVFQHGGVIDKFLGDGVLAVFGSPEPDPQQHHHAVRAAVALRQAVQAMADRRVARGDIACPFRIGLHCGEAFHGFVGALDRLEYTVIGDVVNRACRYCQAANEGEILISHHLFQHVFNLVKAEKTTVQSKEGELPVYRVKEMKPG